MLSWRVLTCRLQRSRIDSLLARRDELREEEPPNWPFVSPGNNGEMEKWKKNKKWRMKEGRREENLRDFRSINNFVTKIFFPKRDACCTVSIVSRRCSRPTFQLQVAWTVSCKLRNEHERLNRVSGRTAFSAHFCCSHRHDRLKI